MTQLTSATLLANNQKNVVIVQESDTSNLVNDAISTSDFEKGIDFLLDSMGMSEPEDYKQLAKQGLER